MCNVRCTWWLVKSLGLAPGAYDVHLHSVAKRGGLPNDLLAALSPDLHGKRSLEEMPSSLDHNQRREWQATHAVYPDNLDTCYDEAPSSLWSELERHGSCDSCYAWPFLHMVILFHVLFFGALFLCCRCCFRAVRARLQARRRGSTRRGNKHIRILWAPDACPSPPTARSKYDILSSAFWSSSFRQYADDGSKQ